MTEAAAASQSPSHIWAADCTTQLSTGRPDSAVGWASWVTEEVGWRPWENSAPADGSGESLLLLKDALAEDESGGQEAFSVFSIPFVFTTPCSLGHPHVPERGFPQFPSHPS